MNYLTLLAQEAAANGWLERFIRPETLVFCVPIVFLIGLFAYKITTAIVAHRERMAKIQQGIDPDAPERRA